MGKTTIPWTDYTFNPWWGCTKKDVGCQNCYAESLAFNSGYDVFGKGKDRRYFPAERHWRQLFSWNAAAERAGERRKVFIGSMCDVFDEEVPDRWRQKLWTYTLLTPHLIKMLVTKRPENVRNMLPDKILEGWENKDPTKWRDDFWLLTSICNEETAAAALPHMMDLQFPVLGISCEPAIGPVDWSLYFEWYCPRCHEFVDAVDTFEITGTTYHKCPNTIDASEVIQSPFNWLIYGGEGLGRRPLNLHWAREAKDKARYYDIPFFMKQMGSDIAQRRGLKDWKGEDPSEWPEEFRVREFPYQPGQ